MTPLLTELLNALSCSIHVSPLLVFAALPPLSQDELANEAEVVIVGTVGKVSQSEVKVPDGNDVRYSAPLTVAKVEKSLIAVKEKTVTISYRQTGERPPGWTGPAGQTSLPKEGDTVRVFGRFDAKGKLNLVEPNGWQRVSVK